MTDRKTNQQEYSRRYEERHRAERIKKKHEWYMANRERLIEKAKARRRRPKVYHVPHIATLLTARWA